MTKRLVLFALAVTTFAAAPHALKAADADALCPLGTATVRGAYMTQGTGSIVGVGPIFVVGVMTFDGKGTGVLTSTSSVNGVISRGTVFGPYTVHSDCTMTLILSNGTHYDSVIVSDGSTGYFVETDTGTVLGGTRDPARASRIGMRHRLRWTAPRYNA